MERAYTDILEKRNELLQKELKWSKDLARTLCKEGVLSRDSVQEIERENGGHNRVYRLLAKLSAEQGPCVFSGLCATLRKTDHQHLAESLEFDRNHVVWDFQRGASEVQSLPEYIGLIDEQLVSRLVDEEDDYMRDVLQEEVRRRLRHLIRFLKQHAEMDRSVRRDILEVCQSPTGKKLAHLEDAAVSGLQGLADSLNHLNDFALQELDKCVGALREDKQQLQAEIEGMKEEMEQPEYRRNPVDVASNDQRKKIRVLHDTIQEQDKELIRLKAERQSGRDFVRIPKPEFDKLLNTLQPYVRKSSIANTNPLSKDNGLKVQTSGEMAQLNDAIGVILKQIDRLRGRVNETTGRITGLEKERALVTKALSLQESGTDGWAQQVLHAFSEMEEDRNNLNVETDSMGSRIARLAEENAALSARLCELENSNEETLDYKASPKPRQRRSAISLRPSTPRQTNNTKTRRCTVGDGSWKP